MLFAYYMYLLCVDESCLFCLQMAESLPTQGIFNRIYLRQISRLVVLFIGKLFHRSGVVKLYLK